MKKAVMTLAHKVKQYFNTFSEALIFAWAKYKLQTRLHAGEVSFDFRKKSTGEIRRAKGTLKFDIPHVPSKKGCAWYIQKFKDVDINQWRCLDIRTLIKIHLL